MLAAGQPDTPVGWMIVAREIALLATELGRVHYARGDLDCAQQIETELCAELAQIEAALEGERPTSGEDLDAEAQAAKHAREPPAAPGTRSRPAERGRGGGRQAADQPAPRTQAPKGR
jgi:hypothetical protein